MDIELKCARKLTVYETNNLLALAGLRSVRCERLPMIGQTVSLAGTDSAVGKAVGNLLGLALVSLFDVADAMDAARA